VRATEVGGYFCIVNGSVPRIKADSRGSPQHANRGQRRLNRPGNRESRLANDQMTMIVNTKNVRRVGQIRRYSIGN